MTNPNIPPEIADSPAKWKSDDRVCTRWDLCPLAGQLHSHSPTPAPAPVRISPEVRETIRATLAAAHEHHLRWAKATPVHYDSYATNWFAVGKLDAAIAFVEALP